MHRIAGETHRNAGANSEMNISFTELKRRTDAAFVPDHSIFNPPLIPPFPRSGKHGGTSCWDGKADLLRVIVGDCTSFRRSKIFTVYHKYRTLVKPVRGKSRIFNAKFFAHLLHIFCTLRHADIILRFLPAGNVTGACHSHVLFSFFFLLSSFFFGLNSQ